MNSDFYLFGLIRMQRNKGQFTSSKKSDGAYGWGGGQDSGQDDIQQETTCVLQSFGIY